MEKQGKQPKASDNTQRQRCRRWRLRLDRKMPITINCKQCGKEFKTKQFYLNKGYGKYCSSKCFGKAKTKKINCNCRYCGKHFLVKSHELKRGHGKFCSRKCQYKARAEFEEYSGENNPDYNRIERNCINCGKTMKLIPSYITKGGGKFCNRKCYSEYKIKTDTYSGKNSCFYNRTEKTCLRCGKLFTVIQSKLKLGKGKYCSKFCSGREKSGKNSMWWKGGYFPYYGCNWELERRNALNRANHVSELSKKSDKKLNVHHIIPMRAFIETYLELCISPYIDNVTLKTFAVLPYELVPDLIFEEANSQKNLMVLTNTEHKRFEKNSAEILLKMKYKRELML